MPAGARVHLELHSPNGPSGSIPIEQLTNLHARRQQTPQTQSANILNAVNGLAALPTFSRWYDSAKLFYGSTAQERASKIANHIVLMLLPAAREASAKARAEEEEKTKELESKAKKEEEEKAQKEAGEKAKKEQEQKEAREQQAREEEMREAERPQEAQPETQSESQPQAEQQEDVEMAEDTSAQQSQEAVASAPRERVSVQINGRDVDITDTGIDPSWVFDYNREVSLLTLKKDSWRHYQMICVRRFLHSTFVNREELRIQRSLQTAEPKVQLQLQKVTMSLRYRWSS